MSILEGSKENYDLTIHCRAYTIKSKCRHSVKGINAQSRPRTVSQCWNAARVNDAVAWAWIALAFDSRSPSSI